MVHLLLKGDNSNIFKVFLAAFILYLKSFLNFYFHSCSFVYGGNRYLRISAAVSLLYLLEPYAINSFTFCSPYFLFLFNFHTCPRPPSFSLSSRLFYLIFFSFHTISSFLPTFHFFSDKGLTSKTSAFSFFKIVSLTVIIFNVIMCFADIPCNSVSLSQLMS